jgi:hypothetical protein
VAQRLLGQRPPVFVIATEAPGVGEEHEAAGDPGVVADRSEQVERDGRVLDAIRCVRAFVGEGQPGARMRAFGGAFEVLVDLAQAGAADQSDDTSETKPRKPGCWSFHERRSPLSPDYTVDDWADRVRPVSSMCPGAEYVERGVGVVGRLAAGPAPGRRTGGGCRRRSGRRTAPSSG